MKRFSAVLIVLGVLGVEPEPAAAQFRTELWAQPAAELPQPPAARPQPGPLSVDEPGARFHVLQDGVVQASSAAPYGRVVAGTVAGGVLGAAAGLGVALLVSRPGDAEMFPGDLAAGTMFGGVAGMYFGARVGSRGRGNPWLTGAAAVGGSVAGVLAGAAAGDALAQAGAGRSPEVVAVLIGAGIPVALTSWVEWRAGRRH